jgi:NADH-quinone oxidoreductase subunit E
MNDFFNTENVAKGVLSEEVKGKIDNWLIKFPKNCGRSVILVSLHLVQDENGGFVSSELIAAISDYLLLPHIFVYEVASFYNMYNLVNPVRNKICICTNITCSLYGSDFLVRSVRDKYSVGLNNVSGDGSFFLSEVECLALCDKAPVVQVNKKYFFNITEKMFFELIDGLKE